jgi:hypothetical protein
VLEKLNSIKDKFLRANLLSFILSNKKINKNTKEILYEQLLMAIDDLKSSYYYYTTSFNIKNYFNSNDTDNNISPSLLSTQDFINYTININYNIKYKYIIPEIIKKYNLENNTENSKKLKELINSQNNDLEINVKTKTGEKIVLLKKELTDKKIIKKNYKEVLKFYLNNLIPTNNIYHYPMCFNYVKLDNNNITFHILSEEDLNEHQHYILSKYKLNRILNGK